MLMTMPIDDLSAAIRSPATWFVSAEFARVTFLATHPVVCPACGQMRLLYVVRQAPEPGHVQVGCLSDCARSFYNP